MQQPTAPDTWFSRDFPVLVAAVTRIDEERPHGGVRLHELAETTRLDPDTVYASLRALEDAGLVECRWVMPATHGRVVGVSGGARQLAGSWPTDESFAQRLVDAVTELEQHASDDDQRSKLQKLREALTSAGRDIVVSVAAAAISGQIPR